jgi:predicted secreted protein
VGGLERRLNGLSGSMQIVIGLGGALVALGAVLVVLYMRSGQLIFSIGTSIAIFFVIWWTSLFAVLPFGVRSQAEAGEVEAGSDPGAPARANLLWYALVNSAVAGLASIIFLIWVAPLI